MDVDPREHPMSIQIFGGTEETLLQAAQYVDQHTDADIIDINISRFLNSLYYFLDTFSLCLSFIQELSVILTQGI